MKTGIRTVTDRGHAAAYLREMFCEALAFGAEDGNWWEWFVTARADQFLGQQREGGDWCNLDAKQRAGWLMHRLWYNTEIVPENVLGLLNLPPGQTYAQVARRAHREISNGSAVFGRLPASTSSIPSSRPPILPGMTGRLTLASQRANMTNADVMRRARTAWLSGQADRGRGDS